MAKSKLNSKCSERDGEYFCTLALALFVTGVFTGDENPTAAADYFAIPAALFDRGLDFHGR